MVLENSYSGEKRHRASGPNLVPAAFSEVESPTDLHRSLNTGAERPVTTDWHVATGLNTTGATAARRAGGGDACA